MKLQCIQCNNINYLIKNNKITNKNLTLLKHCKTCNKHIKHIETR